MKTAEKTKTEADLKREQIVTDSDRAYELSKAYDMGMKELDNLIIEVESKIDPIKAEYEEKIQPIKTLYNPRLDSAKATLESIAEEMIEIGKRQRYNLFDVKDNWHLEEGVYLHVKTQTEAQPGPLFDLGKFVNRFLEYTDVKFKIDALKKVFTNADHPHRQPIMDHDLELVTNETIEVKKKKEKSKTNE